MEYLGKQKVVLLSVCFCLALWELLLSYLLHSAVLPSWRQLLLAKVVVAKRSLPPTQNDYVA